ncbi:MAG TPA: D-glycero-beta-D-manno-heptose-7-phosphate kinase [Exilispira sp.]|nr:D-glycero-beta-D-manno-heptose-7-phosphate kinase [Exilispira sp.]
MSKKICIIGDIMLDRYLYGKANRISPEAPIPVVLLENESISLGAASYVALNLINLRSDCILVGKIGNDENGKTIKKLLIKNKINNFLIEKDGYKTITKTRIISNHQQMIRVDEEKIEPLTIEEENIIIEFLEKNIKDIGFIIISDYAKGVCTENLCKKIIDIANKKNIKVLIDPKKNNWEKYKNSYLINPNLKELSEFVGFELKNEDYEIEKILKKVYPKLNIENICVKRSEKGITLYDGNKCMHFPAEAIEVYDVTGAGDTVIAVLTLMLNKGYDIEKSITIANKAASIVIQKAGTTPILYDEFISILEKKEKTKLVNLNELKLIIEDLRKKNKKIVFTNGCFDILHAGHVIYLEKAKELGNVLIVGLNTDSSIKKIKGKDRPLQNQVDRAKILSALESVDFVVFFDEPTPENLIKQIKPDILVKGSDYKIEEIVGRQYAGQTVTIEYIDGKSTTSIINKIKKQNS